MSSSAAFQYDDGGNQQPPQTFPNKYIYEEFYGYKGFQYLDTIISKIVSLAYYRTWLKAIKYQIDENMPYIGTARIAEESERSVRKIYMDQQGMQRKGLLSVMPGIVTNKDGKARAVLIKDFSGLYKLAHEYHEWIQAGGEQIFPPNREYIDAIRANPHVYKKIVRYENYRRILLNKRPGRKCTTEQADLFTGEEEFDLQNLNLFTNISVNQDSPYRVYQPNNLTDKENSNSRTHHQEYKDEVSQEEISIPEKEEGFWEQEPEHSYYDYEIHIAHEAAPQAASSDYTNYNDTYYMNHSEEYEEFGEETQNTQNYQDPYLPPPADYNFSPNDTLPPTTSSATVGGAARRGTLDALYNNKQAYSDNNYTSYYGMDQGQKPAEAYSSYEEEWMQQGQRRHERAAARAAYNQSFEQWQGEQYQLEHPEPQLHAENQNDESQAQHHAEEPEQPNLYKQYQERKAQASARKKQGQRQQTPAKEKIRAYLPRSIEDKLMQAACDLDDMAYESSRTQCANLFEQHKSQTGEHYTFNGECEGHFTDIMQMSLSKTRARAGEIQKSRMGYFFKVLRRDLKAIWQQIKLEEPIMDQSNSSSMEYSQENSQFSTQYHNSQTNQGNIVIDAMLHQEPKGIMALPDKNSGSSEISIYLNQPLTEIQIQQAIQQFIGTIRHKVKDKIASMVDQHITVVAEHLTCRFCNGRIKRFERGRGYYCVTCEPHKDWLEHTKRRIEDVLQEIPSVEQTVQILLAGTEQPVKLLE